MKNLISFIIFTLLVSGCGDDRSNPPSNAKAIDAEELAQNVKAEFIHTWEGYKQYAWGHDELRPLSKTYHDWYEQPLLLTPVDAFTTMKVMKLDEQAEEAKALILEQLSFDKDIDVQLFELNIRLLGGLLSAYQLDGDPKFLDLAVDLADRLMPAFDSPTGMPYRLVNLVTGATADPHNNPAEIGTLLLEWGTLSKTTGRGVYYQKVKHAVQTLFSKRSSIDLVGTVINVETGEWEDPSSHISGRIDSYYEYLQKGWRMLGDRDLKDMWDTSIKAVNKYLADETKNGLWYGRADMNTGVRTETYFGALDAFFPAVLALSGDLERARRLQESCYKMWMLYDIEPALLDYSTMEPVVENYILQPENIESAYYLYHYTSDPRYRQMGRDYFQNLVKYCRNDVAYCNLESVKTKKQEDIMQSFFLAETLKYFYLLFSPRETVDFDSTVFNTEAHPLRIWDR